MLIAVFNVKVLFFKLVDDWFQSLRVLSTTNSAWAFPPPCHDSKASKASVWIDGEPCLGPSRGCFCCQGWAFAEIVGVWAQGIRSFHH